jgi:hypothetical protein
LDRGSGVITYARYLDDMVVLSLPAIATGCPSLAKHRGRLRPFVNPFARICKPFRNRRPRSAATGQAAGQPTPVCPRSAAFGCRCLLPVTPEAAGPPSHAAARSMRHASARSRRSFSVGGFESRRPRQLLENQ